MAKNYEYYHQLMDGKIPEADLTYSNEHATLFKIGNNNLISLSQTNIANTLEDGNPITNIVNGACARMLYKSKEFEDGINQYLSGKSPGKLSGTINKYGILNKKINELFDRLNKKYNPKNNIKIKNQIEDIILDVVTEMKPIEIYQHMINNLQQKAVKNKTQYTLTKQHNENIAI